MFHHNWCFHTRSNLQAAALSPLNGTCRPAALPASCSSLYSYTVQHSLVQGAFLHSNWSLLHCTSLWKTRTIQYRRRLAGRLEWPEGLWKFWSSSLLHQRGRALALWRLNRAWLGMTKFGYLKNKQGHFKLTMLCLFIRPVCKNALCWFRPSHSVTEFLRLIVITGINFRSIGQLEVSNLDPPILSTPLITPKIKVLETMPIWVFRQAQRSGKLLSALFQVSVKLRLSSKSKKPIADMSL